MPSLQLINPEFEKFPPDIQKELMERLRRGAKELILMTKAEIEKELANEEEKRRKTTIKPAPVTSSLDLSVKDIHTLSGLKQEFDRQVEVLIKRGYPQAIGISQEQFIVTLAHFKKELSKVEKMELKPGNLPFILVINNSLLTLEEEIPLMEVDGKKGFTTLNLSELKTAEGVEIPESLAYLVVDVENGKIMLGKSADEAVKQFKKEGRSPLTAEEGVAIITQYPEILKDHYMDLPGSRLGGGGVAVLWLSGGRPGLGWHWADGSSAEWGSASCGSRVGP